MTSIFSCESDEQNDYCIVYGDGCCEVMRYDKNNKTFDDFIEIIIQELYTDHNIKSNIKSTNLILNSNNKKILLTRLLKTYLFGVDWYQYPNCLKIDINNYKLIGQTNGIMQEFIAEDDKYFYYAYYGSCI